MPDFVPIIINAVITALVSFSTIKWTLSSELKKMKFQYNRDDDLAIKDAYSEMRTSISHYISCPNGVKQREAQTALSKFITLAPSEIQPLLQHMHRHLLKQTMSASEITTNLQAIDEAWQNYRTARTGTR